MSSTAGRYIRYLAKARGRHGLHSPMAYNMLDRVYRRPPKLPEALSSYIKKLESDPRVLQVADQGAGSHILQREDRKVKDIQRIAGSGRSQARIILGISQLLNPAVTLEFGTCLGVSTSALALGNPQGRVTTVEADAHSFKIASGESPAAGMSTKFVHATFQEFLDSGAVPTDIGLFSLDGDHRYQATLDYVEQLKPRLASQACLILDDIRWSEGMFKAWEELTVDNEFQLSLDMGNKGLLFKIPNTVKQDFTLRNWRLK